MIPLVIAHIPALVAYLLSEHAWQDAYVKRQNACAVLEEFIKMAKKEPHDLLRVVEKCKGSVKCPASFATKTLHALHDALSKSTPTIQRPVEDPEDTCNIDAWTHECSFVRDLCGMQLDTGGVITHPLVLDVKTCVSDALANVTVRRAPLVLVCALDKKTSSYPLEFTVAGVRYALDVVGTASTVMHSSHGTWYVQAGDAHVPLQNTEDIITSDAVAIVYRRI